MFIVLFYNTWNTSSYDIQHLNVYISPTNGRIIKIIDKKNKLFFFILMLIIK